MPSLHLHLKTDAYQTVCSRVTMKARGGLEQDKKRSLSANGSIKRERVVFLDRVQQEIDSCRAQVE